MCIGVFCFYVNVWCDIYLHTGQTLKNDDDLAFSVPFNIIYVKSRSWKGDNERLRVLK